METSEFLIFLSVDFVLLMLTLTRKAMIFSVIGTILSIFFMGSTLASPLVLDRFYITNSTGIVATETTYANPTITILVLFCVIMCHILVIVKVKD